MSMIAVSNLTFYYDGNSDFIFKNVSFQIDTDWKLGFTGRNGRGKTTFLKLLMGEYEYQGSIQSTVKFEYFPFEIENKTGTTLEMVQKICPNVEQWQIQRELSLLLVEEDAWYRPFYTLSNGEQTKVSLAALFLRENRFLLIDEPTNHLDQQARKMVAKYLKKKTGFLLVSHDRSFLDGCIDHILSINKANIEIQKGNFSSWWENKKRQDQFELAENEKLKGEIKKLSVSARRTSTWSNQVEQTKIGEHSFDRGFIGHKAAKMMQRAKNIEYRRNKALDEKQSLLKNLESAEKLSLSPLKYSKKELLILKDLSLQIKEKTICQKVSFCVEQGDRIALCGKNGCGKSSILKLILGQSSMEYKGTFLSGYGLKISYVPQDSSFLQGKLKDFILEREIDESLLKAILRKLDFSREQFEKKMENFSEGQKKKVLLAASLCQRSHLYIWDEPLNFVDVLSRMQLEQLILEYCPTMIFVEHDRFFVERVATKIIYI